MKFTAEQLTGRDDSHLVEISGGGCLCPGAAAAFARLQQDAQAAGFELAVASSYRSFDRQLAIFNGKACGERTVHDDAGLALDVLALPAAEALRAILRYSALPGTSRHHWGTDLDVFDAAALPPGYRVQLTPGEVVPGGVFDPLHNWLDQCMAEGLSHGFFRPYGEDRGGVAPERWHLSYAPLAQGCDRAVTPDLLRECWSQVELLMRDELESGLQDLLRRYVQVPGDWCPAVEGG